MPARITEEELLKYDNVPPSVASEFLGKSPMWVYRGLQYGRLPFGVAVKGEKEWSYHIPPRRLIAYVNGTLPQVIIVKEAII